VEPWQREGTIGFFLPEPEPGWRTDRRRHDLPTLRVNRFRLTLSKSEDRELFVEVHGLLDVPLVLRAPLPDGSEPLHVTLIWRSEHIQLHFDGVPAAITPFPDMEAVQRDGSN
jgi:hypothetical protein